MLLLLIDFLNFKLFAFELPFLLFICPALLCISFLNLISCYILILTRYFDLTGMDDNTPYCYKEFRHLTLLSCGENTRLDDQTPQWSRRILKNLRTNQKHASTSQRGHKVNIPKNVRYNKITVAPRMFSMFSSYI